MEVLFFFVVVFLLYLVLIFVLLIWMVIVLIVFNWFELNFMSVVVIVVMVVMLGCIMLVCGVKFLVCECWLGVVMCVNVDVLGCMISKCCSVCYGLFLFYFYSLVLNFFFIVYGLMCLFLVMIVLFFLCGCFVIYILWGMVV